MVAKSGTRGSLNGAFEQLGRRLTDALGEAQKDLSRARQRGAPPATPSGRKTLLFAAVLDQAREALESLSKGCKLLPADGPAGGATWREGLEAVTAGGPALGQPGGDRDRVADGDNVLGVDHVFGVDGRRAIGALGNLCEAYAIIAGERAALEEALCRSDDQIDSLDDVGLVCQYVVALRETQRLSRSEIARLTALLARTEGLCAGPPTAEAGAEASLSRTAALEAERAAALEAERTAALEAERTAALEAEKAALAARVAVLQGSLLQMQLRLDAAEAGGRASSSQMDALERALDEARLEAARQRASRGADLASLRMEANRLKASHEAAAGAFEEERRVTARLRRQLEVLQSERASLHEHLASAQVSLIRQAQSGASTDSLASDVPRAGEAIQRSLRASRDADGAGREEDLKGAIGSLQRECERLALENSRIKGASHGEHTRNVVLRYMQLPAPQRHMLIPIIASLLNFTSDEVGAIRRQQ